MEIPFDKALEQGLIDQDTYDAVKAYMDAHKPAEASEADAQSGATAPEKPEDGNVQEGAPEKPEEGTAPENVPEKPEGNMNSAILNELLEAGILTEAQVTAIEALISAETAETTETTVTTEDSQSV